MRYPDLLCLLIYHWTTTHLCYKNIFLSRPNDNCYISNGRRFAKSALRVLLLSNFRVSSINYSLVSSLPIHTRSSANADGLRAHCQLKSCRILHKCSMDCICKSLQPVNDLQCRSRSLPLLPYSLQNLTDCDKIWYMLSWVNLWYSNVHIFRLTWIVTLPYLVKLSIHVLQVNSS